MLRRILKEPLLHFVVAGSLLFVALSGEDAPLKPEIKISVGKVQQVTAQFTKTRQRPPTEEELASLIEAEIREELAFAQGKQLGLVENDAIIKRRVQQKLEFMLSNSIATIEPSQAELQAFLDSHVDLFTIAPVYSFKHIYVNPEKHVDTQGFLARLQQQDLNSTYRECGDSIMLEPRYKNLAQAQVARIFGRQFALSLAEQPLQVWVGPVSSGFGVHLVYVEEKSASHVAKLANIEAKVRLEFRVDAQKRAIDEFYRELQEIYDVTIEKTH